MDMPTKVSDATNAGNGTNDTGGVKFSGKFQCLHCNQKFETEKPLNLYDKSRGIPSQVSDAAKSGDSTIDKGGVKLSGKFHCPLCNHKFEPEAALNLLFKSVEMPSEVRNAAKSGGFNILSAVVKLVGKHQCPKCNQEYDTEKALNLHSRYIHGDDGGTLFNIGYELLYEFKGRRFIEDNDDSFGTRAKSVSKL